MPIFPPLLARAAQAWFLRARHATLSLLLPWLAAIISQSIGRIYLLWTYAGIDRHELPAADVLRSLVTGLRFDTKVATLVFVPILLASLLLAAHKRLHGAWMGVLPAVGASIVTAIAATALVNALYITHMSRRVDIFVFGLFEDDTSAILQTLWQSYPIIVVLLLLLAWSYLLWRVARRWNTYVCSLQLRPCSLGASVGKIALALMVVVVAGRGALGTFPLRISDVDVSTEQRLNDITPNGITALHAAWRIRKHAHGFHPVEPGQEGPIFERFLQQRGEALRPFLARTSANAIAQANPPHVVLQIMESMGAHLLRYDSPQRDLMGALRRHWDEDWLFERFLSEGNGTIDSISRLLVRSPVASIGQTAAGQGIFASNAFTPFLEQGYRVVFVTSGPETWRNLRSFALHLGAHEFVGQRGLLERYPEARAITWGVPDEYMFRYIETRLDRAEHDGERLFVIALSATHHPPFELPKYVQPATLEVAEVAAQAYFEGWPSPSAVFQTLHYTNDQLGRFLDRLKVASVGQRTIVGVTGDHNILGVRYTQPEDTVLAKAVPFYLYVPASYRTMAHYDPARIGSHKDILPTLYHLSLSDAAYYRTGCNLLAPSADPIWCFGFNNPDLVITRDGAFQHDRPERIQPWAHARGLAVAPERTATPDEEAQRLRLQAYRDLLRWQIDYQVQQAREASRAQSLTPPADATETPARVG